VVDDNLFRKSDETAHRLTLWRCCFVCRVVSVFTKDPDVPSKRRSYLVTTEGDVESPGTCKPKQHIRFLTLLMNFSNRLIRVTKQMARCRILTAETRIWIRDT
jgi:hypothetical protein